MALTIACSLIVLPVTLFFSCSGGRGERLGLRHWLAPWEGSLVPAFQLPHQTFCMSCPAWYPVTASCSRAAAGSHWFQDCHLSSCCVTALHGQPFSQVPCQAAAAAGRHGTAAANNVVAWTGKGTVLLGWLVAQVLMAVQWASCTLPLWCLQALPLSCLHLVRLSLALDELPSLPGMPVLCTASTA